MIIAEDIDAAAPPPRRRGVVRRTLARLAYTAFGRLAAPAALAVAEDAMAALADERADHAATVRKLRAEIDGLEHETKNLAKLFDASVARLDLLIATCEAGRTRFGER